MSIAPTGFDQNTPRPSVASLGDAAAVDGVSSGAFAGYETEIPHQLARSLKARQIADRCMCAHIQSARRFVRPYRARRAPLKSPGRYRWHIAYQSCFCLGDMAP